MLDVLPALIGFFGVCATLYWNARSVRADRARDRESDRQALIASLEGEIASNQKILEPYCRAFAALPASARGGRLKILKLDRVFISDIYDGSIHNFGLLGSTTIRLVTTSYSRIKMLSKFVQRLETAVGADNGWSGIVILVGRENETGVRYHIEQCSKALQEALEALEIERTGRNTAY